MTTDDIRRALAGLGLDGRLLHLGLSDGAVSIVVDASGQPRESLGPTQARIEETVGRLAGVRRVAVAMTAERGAAQTQADPPPARDLLLADIPVVIAVASGKGGVGKSTVAVNLALALAGEGLATGLLDADIHGPSLPGMLGLHGPPEITAERTITPARCHGISCMSMGLIVEDDTPMIWRGPMVMGALEQLMRDVAWDCRGSLQAMVIDLPPGTGDAQLTIARRTTLSGVVMVTTPQDVALADVRRAMAMFRKVEVPVLGLVENMAGYQCPHCGTRSHVFPVGSGGGARGEAERTGCPYLGEIPLDPRLPSDADQGRPLLVSAPESPTARAFVTIARTLLHQLSALPGSGPPV